MVRPHRPHHLARPGSLRSPSSDRLDPPKAFKDRLCAASGARGAPRRGYARPDTPNPRRPVATYDRFLKLRKHAGKVDPQRLFASFLELVEALGWRVSAICRLWASDVDLARTKAAPHGRIRKREENDKERVEIWVPLSAAARAALEWVLSSRQVVGDVWLFPAPRRPAQPWSRHHAKDLLDRATAAAKLEPLAGGDFHPFRRKWVTERKHLLLTDVAAAGGWKTVQTLEQSYARADSETMLAVVTAPEAPGGQVIGYKFGYTQLRKPAAPQRSNTLRGFQFA